MVLLNKGSYLDVNLSESSALLEKSREMNIAVTDLKNKLIMQSGVYPENMDRAMNTNLLANFTGNALKSMEGVLMVTAQSLQVKQLADFDNYVKSSMDNVRNNIKEKAFKDKTVVYDLTTVYNEDFKNIVNDAFNKLNIGETGKSKLNKYINKLNAHYITTAAKDQLMLNNSIVWTELEGKKAEGLANAITKPDELLNILSIDFANNDTFKEMAILTLGDKKGYKYINDTINAVWQSGIVEYGRQVNDPAEIDKLFNNLDPEVKNYLTKKESATIVGKVKKEIVNRIESVNTLERKLNVSFERIKKVIDEDRGVVNIEEQGAVEDLFEQIKSFNTSYGDFFDTHPEFKNYFSSIEGMFNKLQYIPDSVVKDYIGKLTSGNNNTMTASVNSLISINDEILPTELFFAKETVAEGLRNGREAGVLATELKEILLESKKRERIHNLRIYEKEAGGYNNLMNYFFKNTPDLKDENPFIKTFFGKQAIYDYLNVSQYWEDSFSKNKNKKLTETEDYKNDLNDTIYKIYTSVGSIDKKIVANDMKKKGWSIALIGRSGSKEFYKPVKFDIMGKIAENTNGRGASPLLTTSAVNKFFDDFREKNKNNGLLKDIKNDDLFFRYVYTEDDVMYYDVFYNDKNGYLNMLKNNKYGTVNYSLNINEWARLGQ